MKSLTRFTAIAAVAVLSVACAALERAVAPDPGAQCKPHETTCKDQWGSCCPGDSECRAPIPAEGRAAHCAMTQDPYNWSTTGAKPRITERTPKVSLPAR